MSQKIEASFSVLIMSIASSALISMGMAPIEAGSDKTLPPDKNMARFNIDLLILLKEKTKNNLTHEESQLIDSLLNDLQIKFVQMK